MTLKNGLGEQINVYHLYVINGVVFTDTKKAKLYQVWLKLQGKADDGVFLAVSFLQDNEGFIPRNQVLGKLVLPIISAFEARNSL